MFSQKTFYVAMSMIIRAVIGIHDTVNWLWSGTFVSVKSEVPTSTATSAIGSHSGSVRYFESGGLATFPETASLIYAISIRKTKLLVNYLQNTRVS